MENLKETDPAEGSRTEGVELDQKEVQRERAEVTKKLQGIELGLHEVRADLKKWGDPGDKEAFDTALMGVVRLMGRMKDINIERPREWPGRKDWKWE